MGFLHASAFALLVPLWQAPDEPGHVEYACLLGELGQPLTGDDISLRLQGEIISSLARHGFWTEVRMPWPESLPLSFSVDPFLARSGRQVGDEPPLYYLFPALICRGEISIEARLRLIRLFGALLFGLTGVVAAWGFRGTGKQADSPSPPVYQSTNLPLLPLFLVLLPMPAFIAGSANNDALAMVTATAVFAAVLRIQRLGWTWRRAVGLALLMVLALASKKINSFLLPWLTIVGLAMVWQWLRRRDWPPSTVAKILAGTTVVAIVLLLPSNTPASWRTIGLPWVVRRFDATGLGPPGAPGSPAVVSIDHSRRGVIQTITGRPVRALHGQIVRASVWVRSLEDQPVVGRLIVRDAPVPSEVEFVATDQWQSVEISHTVALTATRVKLAVAVGTAGGERQSGSLLISDIGLFPWTGAATADSLVRNGDFSRSARLGELLLVAPLQDLWQRFAPRTQTGDKPAGEVLMRYGLYSLLTFAGFWGNFGWLQRPLPIWVYAVLAAICLLAAAGVFRFLRRSSLEPYKVPRGIVGTWLLAVALAAGQVFAPMLGRPWQPQGRYLFPVLLPIIGLLLVGLDAWLDFDRHPRRLAGLLGVEIALVVLCLAVASTA